MQARGRSKSPIRAGALFGLGAHFFRSPSRRSSLAFGGEDEVIEWATLITASISPLCSVRLLQQKGGPRSITIVDGNIGMPRQRHGCSCPRPKPLAGEKRGKRFTGGYVRRWHGIRALPNALHDAGHHSGRRCTPSLTPVRSSSKLRQCSPHRCQLCGLIDRDDLPGGEA